MNAINVMFWTGFDEFYICDLYKWLCDIFPWKRHPARPGAPCHMPHATWGKRVQFLWNCFLSIWCSVEGLLVWQPECLCKWSYRSELFFPSVTGRFPNWRPHIHTRAHTCAHTHPPKSSTEQTAPWELCTLALTSVSDAEVAVIVLAAVSQLATCPTGLLLQMTVKWSDT